MDSLVSTDWLKAQLGAPDVRVLDASWFLPGEPRDAAAEFAAAHIPGAVFLNLGALRDAESPYPMTLPSAEAFAAAMGALGVSDQDRIIVYDNSPVHTAARAWWMLARVYGAASVAVLDGGFGKWRADGFAIESGMLTPTPATFKAHRDDRAVRFTDQMLANVESGAATVIDARGPGRFTGADPEPRAEIASGHIPGSVNLPYGTLFAADGTMLGADDLRAGFAAAGVDLTRPLVTTCGSGVTAAVLALAAERIGMRDIALYDGSWSEWGALAHTPKSAGL